ncbi:8-amino-7-oxononanoate synthase [Vampirovibrio sp.]|uniref:8-amino-7-oxononanoate synthase n=1 Tax=Vampirovibrio sp. TaxID=2717857 RepID=UPI00359410A7
MLLSSYAAELKQKAQQGQLRRCKTVETIPIDVGGPQVRVDGRLAVNFSSNDYLGLSHHPRLQAAAIAAVQQYGTGSAASRLICGTNPLVVELETELARFKKAEAALVFNSGYQANVAILQAILGPQDWVFCDRLNHASLMDGCLLSKARWSRYRHLDLGHLEEKLAKAPPQARKWIVTDSVFSMDGDFPDLKGLVALAERYQALVMVDEAHATGLYGATGSGLCQQFGVSERVALQMGTFSKALGGSGAYVAGSRVLIDWLINHARGFIYSTAQSPPVIGAALAAVKLVQSDFTQRERLWQNMATLQRAVVAAGLTHRISVPLQSPIVPVLIGESVDTLRVSDALLAAGYFVQAIRPPTVPPKTGRLRIALSASHTEAQILGLVKALAPLLVG